jgi:hypothetical protein
MKKSAFGVLSTLLLTALLASSAFAQQITATLTGTVMDPNGAVVPGAAVTVTSIDTGLVKTTTTNDNGAYTVPFLQPGTYNIAIDKTGFSQVTRENIRLEVAQTAGIDIQLGITAEQATVLVEGDETPLLQTETSNLETTIEQRLVEDLPSVERNIFSFVNLVPGTIDTNVALGNPNGAVGSAGNRNFFDSNFSVNGGRASTNDVLLDGVTNTIGDFNGVTISPPQDAIREFKVISGVAPAEYGRTGGGIITISSRSGTRKFRGSLYEYFQDGNLNANGWARNRQSLERINDLSRHQFGGAIGGPVFLPWFGEGTPSPLRKLSDTFFFFNYEARREKNPFTRSLTLPTARMRAGDLSELLDPSKGVTIESRNAAGELIRRQEYLFGANNPGGAAGAPVLFGQIFNPYVAPAQLVPYTIRDTNLQTGVVTNRTVMGRPIFAQNNLTNLPACPSTGPRTQACIDPVARNVLQYLPLPNRPGLANNYIVSDTVDFTRDILAARIDHTLSERQNFFVRFSYEKRRNAPPNFFGTPATNVSVVNDKFYNTTLNHVYSLTPTVINNIRYGFTRAAAQQGPNSFGFDPTTLGFPSSLAANASALVFPTFTIGGGSDGLTSPGEITTGQIGGSGNEQARDTHNVSDSITWLKGKHTVRLGGEYRLYRFYPFQFLAPTGSFSFNRFATRGPEPTTSPNLVESSGSSLASFFLGIPSGISQEVVQPMTIWHHYGAAYAQDDWKVLRNLTLNLGLRWDFETATANKQQLITNFDFDAPSPLQGRLNLTNLDPAVAQLNPGIRNLTGLLDFPEGPQSETNLDRFAPRIGFAYGINEKTTVRGGFGMFFLPTSLEAITALGTNLTNSQIQTSFNTNATSQVTASTVFLSNPFPNGFNAPTGNSLGANTLLGGNLPFVVEPVRPNPYNMQWNLVVQRELARNLVLDVAYVGSRGRNLPTRDIQLNQISSKAIEYARANYTQPTACGNAPCNSIATFFAQQVANPFAGLLPSVSAMNGATIARAQLLRRFPQYQSVGSARPHIGISDYHAMQVNLQKRFSNGFSLLSNYTWSKLLDTAGVGSGASFTDPTNVEDISNYEEEYSYSTLDVPHRFTVSFTYELPFGKGKRFGSEWSGLTDALFGGFQVSGSAVYQKGAPLTITYNAFPGSGLTAIGNSQRRPLRVDGVSANFDREEYLRRARAGESVFNPDAFAHPGDFEFGGARTYNDIRRDNYNNVDLSFIKNVNFEGGKKLQLRAEFMNIFNSVVFGTPGLQYGSATFGKITTQGNRPRIIQLVGRFTF